MEERKHESSSRQIAPISLSTAHKRGIPPSTNKPPTNPNIIRGRRHIIRQSTSPTSQQRAQGISSFKTTSGVKAIEVRETIAPVPKISNYKEQKKDSGLISNANESHVMKSEKVESLVNEPIQGPCEINKMASTVKRQRGVSRIRLSKSSQHAHSESSTQTENDLIEPSTPSPCLTTDYTTTALKLKELQESHSRLETEYSSLKKSFIELQESHSRLETEYSSLKKSFIELSVPFMQDQRYIIEKSAESDRKGLTGKIQQLQDQLKESTVKQSEIEKYQQDIAYLKTHLTQYKKDIEKTLENYSKIKGENDKLKELNEDNKVKTMQRRNAGTQYLEDTLNVQTQDINQLIERNEELEEENRQLKRHHFLDLMKSA